MARKTPIADRFWRKVLVRGPDDCWEWTGAKSPFGYGCFGQGKDFSSTRAHRISWEMVNGPIGDGLCACHRCDNPGCVNPGHIFLGTRKDNVDDMVSKGRQVSATGEDHPFSKLTAEGVRALREEYRLATGGRGGRAPHKFLSDRAKIYGVTEGTLSSICSGRIWKGC